MRNRVELSSRDTNIQRGDLPCFPFRYDETTFAAAQRTCKCLGRFEPEQPQAEDRSGILYHVGQPLDNCEL